MYHFWAAPSFISSKDVILHSVLKNIICSYKIYLKLHLLKNVRWIYNKIWTKEPFSFRLGIPITVKNIWLLMTFNVIFYYLGDFWNLFDFLTYVSMYYTTFILVWWWFTHNTQNIFEMYTTKLSKDDQIFSGTEFMYQAVIHMDFCSWGTTFYSLCC